jgi:hypothetical protein
MSDIAPIMPASTVIAVRPRQQKNRKKPAPNKAQLEIDKEKTAESNELHIVHIDEIV